MKNIISVILLLILMVFTFNSCKKTDVIIAPSQNISLTFNGASFSSPNPVALYSKSQGVILISGAFGPATAATSGITLSIQGYVNKGSYDIASGAASALYANGTNLTDAYTGVTGSIVITTITSTYISGTFQFTATDLNNLTGTVTNGTFSSKLTTQ